MNERFDPGAAIVGFVFIALGIVFMLEALDVWEVQLGVIVSALVIGLGVAVLASAVSRSGERR